MTYNSESTKLDVSELFKALGDPSRRAILERLHAKEASVKELTVKFKISQPAVSQHIAVLRKCRLLSERHEGRKVFYRVNPEGMRPLMDWLTYYKAFWPERIKDLKKLLKEMD